MLSEFDSPPIDYLLVKVAARCNIDCSYCYWFRDPSVYDRPKLMSAAVLAQLLRRVEEQIVQHSLPSFSILLHGGEPMLWGVDNFRRIGEECRSISARTGKPINLAVTTNGVLIDDAWLDCFQEFDVAVTISIDGPAHIHDIHRRSFQGAPTHAHVEQGLRLLQSRSISLGALAVCNPAHDPAEFFQFFADADIDSYDIMFPDATCDDHPPSIAQFYCDLFDLWLKANRDKRTVGIRTIESMLAGLLGGESKTEAIGYGPVEVCTVLTDGSMEPLDVLRIAGNASTRTSCNIFDNGIEEIKDEPRWRAARKASVNLCEKCRNCTYMQTCGGGYLPHRFSKQNGYDNPSVYCEDLIKIFSHMQSVLANQVYISTPTGERIKVGEAAAFAS